jgi:hypothetical protein
MRATLGTLVTVVAFTAAPVARADDGHQALHPVEHQPLNQLGDHVAIPGFVAGQAFTFDFQLNAFQVRGDELFAIGILSGGNLSSPAQVAIPVRGLREHRGRGGPEIHGGFGARERATPTHPAVFHGEVTPLVRTAFVQQSSSPLVVPAQATQACQVVNLALGAVNLNVLGIMVNLQPVALDVAVANAGLVGALVCALVGLL